MVSKSLLFSREVMLNQSLCAHVKALGPDVPVKEAAQGALQKSYRLLNQAKQLQNDVQGNTFFVAVINP